MKKSIAVIILLAALALLPQASAKDKDVWVSTMVRAYHTDRKQGYNENTLGLGWEVHASDKLRYALGGYNNSFNRASYYGSVAYMPLQFGHLRVGGMVGIITGYKTYNYGPGPMAAGVVSYEKNGKGWNLIVVPPVPSDPRPTWTFGLQLKMKVS